jgi:hypothetical protein
MIIAVSRLFAEGFLSQTHSRFFEKLHVNTKLKTKHVVTLD